MSQADVVCPHHPALATNMYIRQTLNCSLSRSLPGFLIYKSQRPMQVLELPKGLFTAGYKAVLHVHSVTEECEIQALISQIDPKTKTEKKVSCRCRGVLVLTVQQCTTV